MRRAASNERNAAVILELSVRFVGCLCQISLYQIEFLLNLAPSAFLTTLCALRLGRPSGLHTMVLGPSVGACVSRV